MAKVMVLKLKLILEKKRNFIKEIVVLHETYSCLIQKPKQIPLKNDRIIIF
jgi:hypothetical protein